MVTETCATPIGLPLSESAYSGCPHSKQYDMPEMMCLLLLKYPSQHSIQRCIGFRNTAEEDYHGPFSAAFTDLSSL